MTGTAWWRLTAVVLVAALIAVLAFGFRFNPLGGFDNDHFVHLLRTQMVVNGEQPLRDFADAELRGAWPPLGYSVSGWAQQLWGPTLLAEAYLTAGALALIAAGVFLLSWRLSQRWLLSLIATAVVVLALPKLYNYEKLLMLFVAILLTTLWASAPSWPRLVALSVWTAIAAVVRHDFAIYVAATALVAIAVHESATLAGRLRRVGVYAGVTALLLLPSLIWVQTYGGVVSYVQRTLQSIAAESGRTRIGWPMFELTEGLSPENLIALTYYLYWAVPLVAAAILAALAVRRALTPAAIATGGALVGCALLVNTFFLRGNLLSRYGDAVIPIALVAVWAGAAAAGLQPVVRAMPAVLLVLIGSALTMASDVREHALAAGYLDSWEYTDERFRSAQAELRGLPPAQWTDAIAHDAMSASRYLAECTQPADRVLLATYAPEVPVMAQRLVAGGQGTFGLAFYETEPQQREAVARLESQSVPVVIGSYGDFEGEFVHDYPLVWAYVRSHYREAGTLPADGPPRFRVLVRNDRVPTSTSGTFKLPCFK